MRKIKAFLIDIDGTLIFKNHPIQGAQEIIDLIREKDYSLRFVTNIDSKSSITISKRLRTLGFKIDENEIINPPRVLKSFFSQHPEVTAQIISSKEVKSLFASVLKLDHPDYVIVGDVEEYTNLYTELNTAYRNLLEGSELLAFKQSYFYISPEGHNLDTGAFVKLLEEASGQKATVLGKPSRKFYQYALDNLGVSARETVVIGDSLDTDIKGGFNIGTTTILVNTGKMNAENLENSQLQPDLVIPSIAELFEWL